MTHLTHASSSAYRASGVDIDAGNRFVEHIKPLTERTRRSEVVGGIGGFGGLFRVPLERFKEPVLVASTDGVGTKLLLAQTLGRHASVGIDLVAMCVNDIIVQGAEPLFFLDYYACGQLDVEAAGEVVSGIVSGCEQAGITLLGGETAEMPGLYPSSDYDLAGFCVGMAERSRILDGSRVKVGDQVVGLASSGPHANGFSLIRRILADTDADLEQTLGNRSLAEWLLEPTRIYVQSLLALLNEVDVHALAHITGGGIIDNLPRVLPAAVRARIEHSAWPRPAIFEWLQVRGELPEAEMQHVFNCGIGMIAIVPVDAVTVTKSICRHHDIDTWVIGQIEAGDGAPSVCIV